MLVISLDDARRAVLDACARLPPVPVALEDACGRVLAAEVFAAEDVPPFANSAVDGYAVVAGDTGRADATLAVVGELAAGQSPRGVSLGAGEAVRIMTGAAIPEGADAVVMVEDSELVDPARRTGDGARVRLTRQVAAGTAIRPVGSDVRRGARLFDAGVQVTPAVLGVLASVNCRVVLVHPAARVAVLSTGDELVADGGPLAPGQIRESNLTMLAPLLRQAGCDVRSFGVVRDDEAALESVLDEAAATSDAIVTSGGVSMGDYDVVKAVLGRIAEMRWMQIAIKPAKPFAFGLLPVPPVPTSPGSPGDGTRARRLPVFGLPGNPVSSLVSFELFARPALRLMMGHRQPGRTTIPAVADADLARRRDGKTHLLRVVARWTDDGRLHVVPVTAQGSHQLAATATANALAIVADGEGVPRGAEVPVMLLEVP
jgi:molybdenum cofactor synthesis domain-containing protein